MEFQVRRWNWKTILIGTAGVFVRRNLITILLSIEIMLNAVNLTFVAFGRAFGTVDGQIIVFFVMTVAAAEAGAVRQDRGCRVLLVWLPALLPLGSVCQHLA